MSSNASVATEADGTVARCAWPAAPDFVDAGGVRWSITSFGAGPTALLLHGTGASRASFRTLAPLLAAHFHVIVPDLPGHADSSTPRGTGMSLDGMARSMTALLTALQAQPALVVGHSAGAAVLARMALDRAIAPQAFVGLNAALVPLGGLMRTLSPVAKFLTLAPGVPRLVSGLARDPRAVQRLVDSTGSSIDEEGTQHYATLIRDPRHVAGAIAMMASWNLDRTHRELSRLQPPPLFIVGDRDRTVPPRQATDVAARIAGAQVVTLPGLGHLAHEEAPAAVAGLIVAHARERDVAAAFPVKAGDS